MTTLTSETLRGMVEAIIAVADPKSVVLFGSRARGDAGSDSDVDLMVVVEGEFSRERRRRDLLSVIRRSLQGFSVSKDVLVFTAAEFAHWQADRNHVIGRAAREGRVLYERP